MLEYLSVGMQKPLWLLLPKRNPLKVHKAIPRIEERACICSWIEPQMEDGYLGVLSIGELRNSAFFFFFQTHLRMNQQ
jgi:hypothetical protein